MSHDDARKATIAAVARGLAAAGTAFVYCGTCGWPTTEDCGTCGLCLEDAARASMDPLRPKRQAGPPARPARKLYAVPLPSGAPLPKYGTKTDGREHRAEMERAGRPAPARGETRQAETVKRASESQLALFSTKKP